jgi:hypothetical protein
MYPTPETMTGKDVRSSGHRTSGRNHPEQTVAGGEPDIAGPVRHQPDHVVADQNCRSQIGARR